MRKKWQPKLYIKSHKESKADIGLKKDDDENILADLAEIFYDYFCQQRLVLNAPTEADSKCLKKVG